jgi:anti-sigma B factor antagonist
MKYSVSEKEGMVNLSLAGKIMGGPEATEINDKINQLIDEEKLKIIIDLDGVEWMNSSGLGILIGAVTLLKNNNGDLRLINVSDRIKNLLKITKLQTVFEVCQNFEEAAASLSGEN